MLLFWPLWLFSHYTASSVLSLSLFTTMKEFLAYAKLMYKSGSNEETHLTSYWKRGISM
jgi:hypothetical protein